MEQPNSLGGLLAAFSLCAIPLIRSRELGLLRRGVYLGVYLVSLWVMLFSLSRGAWLGALAGHSVLLLLAWPRVFFASLLAGSLLFPFAYPLAPEAVRERVDETFTPQHRVFRGAAEKFGAGAERIVFYQIGIDMFLESPVWGQGMDSFIMRAPELGARYGMLGRKAPHSLIVKLASESGLIGLGMLGWLAVVTYGVGLRLWRRVPDARWTGLTLLAVTASISASNLVHDSFLGHFAFGGLFWMLFGAAARADFAARRSAPAAVKAGDAPPPLPRWLVGRELLYVKPALAQRGPEGSA
jgi:O-antigen ligase